MKKNWVVPKYVAKAWGAGVAAAIAYLATAQDAGISLGEWKNAGLYFLIAGFGAWVVPNAKPHEEVKE